MKRLLLLLLTVCLSLPLFLTACTEKPDKKILGTWYSESDKTAITLFENYTARIYDLTPGFYEYSTCEDGTFTFDGTTITLDLEYEPLSWTWNESTATMTSTYTSSLYIKMEKVPPKHNTPAFADYSKINIAEWITLPTYEGITLSGAREEIINQVKINVFENYYKKNTTEEKPTVTNRLTQFGDVVVVDYVGRVNGIAFAGGTATGSTVSIIQNSGYIQGFAEGMAGREIGVSFDVPVTFPEDYRETSLAGQAAVFTMTIQTIYDVTIADDKIKTYTGGDYTDYQSFIDYMTKNAIETELWQQVIRGITPKKELDLSLYEYFYQYLVDEYHYYAAQYSMSYESFLQMYGQSDTSLRKTAINDAYSYMAAYLIYQEEKLAYDQGLYDSHLNSMVNSIMNYMSLNKEEATAYVLENQNHNLMAEVIHQTVITWIYKNATLN